MQAHRVAIDYLDDNTEHNMNLLKTVNVIVHALEKQCLVPSPRVLSSDADQDIAALQDYYRSVLSDLVVDREETAKITAYFREHAPSVAQLVVSRATIYKMASEVLQDDSRDYNAQLLKCVNNIVIALERVCFVPREFTFHEEIDYDRMSIQDAVQHLWEIDDNRLEPNNDYRINVGRGKKPFWKEDAARDPLFEYVDPDCFERPTYAAFVALLDNYASETGVAESVTHQERQEVATFLKVVMQTKPMQFCHRYCRAQNPTHIPRDPKEFSEFLHKIWFQLYRRETRNDSSGFEHVFVGEVKDGDVTGFHNWIQFFLEEQRGALDYRGYIKPRSSGNAQADENDHLLSLQFSWKGVEKFVSSSFIGVSPEFEFALYTMCFLVGEEENMVELATGGAENDTFSLKIKCYKIARDKVGTAFPEIMSHFEDDD